MMRFNKKTFINSFRTASMHGTERWLLPFLFAAIPTCGTSLLPAVFNGTSRWGFLLLGFAWVLMHFGKFQTIRSAAVFKLLLLLVFWCFVTSIWSEIFLLSFYKSLAFALVVLTMFTLGASWGRKVAIHEALNCFGLFFVVVLLTSLLGRDQLEFGEVSMFTGLSGNPNYMGFLMATALPFGFWKAYTAASPGHRRTWLLLNGFVFYHLLISHSRASMLLSAFIVAGFMLGTGLKKYFLHIVIAVFAVVVTVLVFPETIDVIYEQYVLKGSEKSVAFENSRGLAYNLSYDAALVGGVTGLGNGISVGADPSRYQGGFSSVGYGREKGSSVLAIVEETGLIGLFFVMTFVLTLFFSAIKLRKYLRANSLIRVVFSMLAGLFLGLVIYSNFEAWWVAPGSAESVLFWGISGVFFGMVLQIRAARAQVLKNVT
jgi:hypothetical protein